MKRLLIVALLVLLPSVGRAENPSPEPAAERWLKELNGTNPARRIAAVTALGQLGADTPAVMEALVEIIQQRDIKVRPHALAVLGKVAALYVQHFQDEAVLRAVDEVENLTSGLARKIWQKITILDRLRATQPPADRA